VEQKLLSLAQDLCSLTDFTAVRSAQSLVM
jgi:hypothetical protein